MLWDGATVEGVYYVLSRRTLTGSFTVASFIVIKQSAVCITRTLSDQAQQPSITAYQHVSLTLDPKNKEKTRY